MSHTSLSLLQGTVDLLILRALQHESPAHGYAVSRFVHARTDGVLALEDAALYQALHRLEARGWVEAAWGLSENNRRAKFYRLTKAGEREFEMQASGWMRLSTAVSRAVTSTDLP
jgi:PadR family transcriptional regulator PadR